MIHDALHTAELVLFGALAWVAALSAALALGLVLIVAGFVHAYRRCT